MFVVWGSWAGLILVNLVLIEQFYIVIFARYSSGTPSNLSDVATAFFRSYLALPVVVSLGTRAHQIDVKALSGSRDQWADPCDV